MIHERYINDHIAKVNPAGVTDVANIAEISACVIPPMRYGEPGILTRVVSPIVIRAEMRRMYRIMRGVIGYTPIVELFARIQLSIIL